MAQDLTTTGDPRDIAESQQRNLAPSEHMFAGRRELTAGAAVGAIAIEGERAIAEAQSAFVVAQRFPRNETESHSRMMQVCARPSFANQAFYSYKRGGEQITGPSIRMAEELARCWRNLTYGMLELNQSNGASEYQAFAHDLETNVKTTQNFTVNHVRNTKSGTKQLTDERDVYEVGANNGARRMRARILAILPAWYVDDAVQACLETLAAKDKGVPLPDQIRKMAAMFLKEFGVTTAMLETRLNHPLEQTQPAEIQTLRGVFTALKDNLTTIADEFVSAEAGAASDKPVVQGAQPDPKPDPKPAAKPAAKDEPKKDEPKKDAAPKADPKPAAPPAEAEPAADAAPAAEKEAEKTTAEADPAPAATQTPADPPPAAGDAGDEVKEGDMF